MCVCVYLRAVEQCMHSNQRHFRHKTDTICFEVNRRQVFYARCLVYGLLKTTCTLDDSARVCLFGKTDDGHKRNMMESGRTPENERLMQHIFILDINRLARAHTMWNGTHEWSYTRAMPKHYALIPIICNGSYTF